MELSTAIAIGIIKAIAMIAGCIAALAFLGFILKALGDGISDLFVGLQGLVKWLLRKWKWLVSFAAILVVEILLHDTEFEFIFQWLWSGFFLFCIAYFFYWKNEESNKKDALYWKRKQANKTSESSTNSTDELKPDKSQVIASSIDDETFVEFLKRHKFIILFVIIFIVIANLF